MPNDLDPAPDIGDVVATHPVQLRHRPSLKDKARAPTTVTLRAYEVYSYLFGEQQALITGDCRGGFGAGELIGFLYARSFPKNEWRMRFDQALEGMEHL